MIDMSPVFENNYVAEKYKNIFLGYIKKTILSIKGQNWDKQHLLLMAEWINESVFDGHGCVAVRGDAPHDGRLYDFRIQLEPPFPYIFIIFYIDEFDIKNVTEENFENYIMISRIMNS